MNTITARPHVTHSLFHKFSVHHKNYRSEDQFQNQLRVLRILPSDQSLQPTPCGHSKQPKAKEVTSMVALKVFSGVNMSD